jgi:hypothetical protein
MTNVKSAVKFCSLLSRQLSCKMLQYFVKIARTRMLQLCCEPFLCGRSDHVEDYSSDDRAPRLLPVELRPSERSPNCCHPLHPDRQSRLPRSSTIRLPRSITTSWLPQNACTKDVEKSSKTQMNPVSTTQDRQYFTRDKKVGLDEWWLWEMTTDLRKDGSVANHES